MEYIQLFYKPILIALCNAPFLATYHKLVLLLKLVAT